MAPSRQILIVAIALAAALLAWFAYDQTGAYERAIARAERDTRNAASLIAQHAARVYGEVEETLQAVTRLRQDTVTGAVPSDRVSIHRLLAAIHGGSPLFTGIGWIDANGNQAASSRFADPAGFNIAGQEHFRVHREGRAQGIYISLAFRSVRDNRLLVNASRTFLNLDGSFGGIVAATLDPAHLASVYSGIELGPSRVVTLFRHDGGILVREPHDEAQVGRSLADRPFISDIVTRAPTGTFRGRGLTDGAERIVSYALVPGVGFIATVALTLDDALAEFRRDFAAAGIALAFMVAILGAGATLLMAQTRRREKLQANLHASEARFRDFAAASGDWFWETDENHRFVWLSPAVETRTGAPAAWHIGKTRTELAVPESVPAEAWAAHQRALTDHVPFRDFEYLRGGAAGERWLSTSGVPVFDETGRFRGYRGSGTDVTDLRRAERRLRDAVEAIPGGFLLFDSSDRLVYVNRNNASLLPEAESITQIGDTFEQIARKSASAGLLTDGAVGGEAWIAERVRRHKAAGGITIVRFKDRILEVHERPTHDGGVMVLRFDVTEREQLAATQRTAREAADAANQAKSEFLSRMSHELRTPLNAIIGFAQMLLLNRPRNLTAEQKEFGEFIAKGGEHLLNLVNEVLDLAGIEAGRMKLSLESVPLAGIASEVLDTMQPVAAKAGVRLDELPAGDVTSVRADRQRLRQILLNLLSNAIKYNRPGGSVRLDVAAAADGWVRISVADTGIGIPPHAQEDLFKPFQRLGAEHTAVEGTGIGLALSRRLVEAMDGRIGYTTEPGQGSVFWVELHVARTAAPAAPAPSVAELAPRAAAGRFSLLYVEDNAANVRLMEHLVATLPDTTMLSAPTGPLGLEMALAHRPDVIVLDLNLPEMNGFDLLRRLRSAPETRDIPVLALSAAAMPADINRGLAAGFFRYITKPLEVNLFLAAVDAALVRQPSPRADASRA